MTESIPVTLPQPDGAHKQSVEFLDPTPTPPKRLCLEGDGRGAAPRAARSVQMRPFDGEWRGASRRSGGYSRGTIEARMRPQP